MLPAALVGGAVGHSASAVVLDDALPGRFVGVLLGGAAAAWLAGRKLSPPATHNHALPGEAD
jgi:hypothetical protein